MKRQINLILMIVLSLVIFIPSFNSVSAQSIAELQKELKDLESERSSIDGEESDAKSQIADNERRQQEVKNKINDIDGQLETTEININTKQQEINATNAEISNLEASISETEAQISDTEAELEKLESELKELESELKTLEAEIVILNEEIEKLIVRIEERDLLIKNRLRSMQHNGGNINYLQVLFGAQSFGDFINRVTAVTKILDSDRTIMSAQNEDKANLEDKRVVVENTRVAVEDTRDTVEDTRDTVEDKKTKLVADKAGLDHQKSQFESKRATLVAQQQELTNLQAQLGQQRTTQVTVVGELEEEFFQLEELKMSIEDQRQILADQERVLAKLLEQRKEEERLAQLAKESEKNEDKAPVSSTALRIPVGGGYRITSGYGMRTHPIFGVPRMHTGVDFARSSFSAASPPIVSAEAGIVVSTGRLGGYGNTVVVYHIDVGLTTLYAHLATISVSPGQMVSRGQQLGIMGTTGDSTGIHLHFEVFEGQYGGTRVNPMKYLQ